jgi:hypothetical protein
MKIPLVLNLQITFRRSFLSNVLLFGTREIEPMDLSSLEKSILATDASLVVDESMMEEETSTGDVSAAGFVGATARSSDPFPGFADESKRRRQAVYLPKRAEGFVERGRSNASAPPHETSEPPPVAMSDFEQPCAATEKKNVRLLLRSRFDETSEQRPNLLDEATKLQTSRLWWRRSPSMSDPELQDMPPDMFMDVCYPQQGFYVKDEQPKFLWNRRYQSIYNLAESTDRQAKFKEFFEQFSAAAIPVAKCVLANLTRVKSPLLHHPSGFTVEVCGLSHEARSLFEDPLRGHKLANREFWGRNAVLSVSCPQLNVPFSLLVEYLGAKALIYPSVPVKQFCGSSELVYGLEEPALFHEKTFEQSDPEVNSIVQRLATYLKMKGHWMGSELKYKKFICAPLDLRVYRSSVDNRIYAFGLRRCTASTVVQSAEDYQPNDYFVDVLRPEFVMSSQKIDLNCDSAMHLCIINKEKDEEERLEELSPLRSFLIPQAAEQMSRDTRISGVEWDYFEKGGMSHFLHSWGINMRFLPLVHQKLLRTKLSGQAQAYVEIEMTVRALKAWLYTAPRRLQDGSLSESDVASHVMLLLQPMGQELWESIVWPVVTKKYPTLSAAMWKFNRLNNTQLLGRLLYHVGVEVRPPVSLSASLNAKRGPLTAAAILARSSVNELCISFVEKVQCPPYPKAPLEEGLDVHLMVIAKRYLREVACDLKYNPLSSKETVERYIEFLSQIGERECDEIAGFYAAELERKDRLLNGSKPVIQETVSDRVIKYRFKGNSGMRMVDVSREACDVFRLYNGQKVQITLGATAGHFSTIIGVHEGALYRHDDGDDGATEVIGRNSMEIQANYGFVVLDRLILQLKNNSSSGSSRPLEDADLASIALVRPYHQPNDRTLVIYESNQESLNLAFGVSHGDRLLFVDGPKKGVVTTVLGAIDGVLWHQLDTEYHPEPYRAAEKDHTNVFHDPRKLVTYFESGRTTFTPYPIDAKAVYDPLFQLFAGFRFLVPCGFYFRQLLLFRGGPYSGRKGAVLGAAQGQLHVLLEHNPIPCSLGAVHAEIVEQHSPKSLGYLSYEPTTVAKPLRTVMYPAMNGELLCFDTSCSACVAIGPVTGQRIKITSGRGGGACGIVIGVRSGRLWAHMNGEDGARPVPVDNVQVLSGSIFEQDPFVLVQEIFPKKRVLNVDEDECSTIMRPFLTCFGEIVDFDLSPRSASPFGFHHGQQIRIQRVALSKQNPAPSSDVITVTVVGVFLDELWYIAEDECFARPIAARTRWELECKFSPSVVGLNLLSGFKDMFCPRGGQMCLSKHDQLLSDPSIQIVKMSNGEKIGVDIRCDSIRSVWQPWRHNMTIIRQDRIVTEVDPTSGVITHHPDGPQAVVVGVCQGEIYLVERAADHATIARNLTKWLPCNDWRTENERSRLQDLIQSLTPVSLLYEKRLGLDQASDPTMFRWWARIHCATKELTLLDTQLHLRLEAARKLSTGKHGEVVYDSEGRKYSVDAMKMNEKDPVTEEPLEHEIRPEPCETVQSYCRAAFNFDIERLLPDLMESILHRIACRMSQSLNGRRPRVIVESRKIHTVFCTAEELDILHECCEIVPEAVTNDIERCSLNVSPSSVNEVAMRLHAIPPKLHLMVLRWVLSCLGLKAISPRWPVPRLCAVLYMMEKLTQWLIDLPTLIEIQSHLEEEKSKVQGQERKGRAEILQEEMMWWRRVSPTFAKVLAADPFFSTGAAPDTAAVSNAHSSGCALQSSDASVCHHQYRFVLSDTTIIHLQPSCMSFQRGDVVEYTFGDISGIQAVILGMESGRLWRYETSGRHAFFGMPFEGTEAEITTRYGLKKLRWEHISEDKILKYNPLRYVTYDGTLVQFDTSCDHIFNEFRMMPGERYLITGRPSPAMIPYPAGTVLVILGLHRNQLWFAIDLTGALPFPSHVKNPAVQFGLRRITSGPVVFPSIAVPGRLVRCMAFLSQEESLFLESGGTAYLVFNVTPQAMATHGASYLLPLQVTHPDPDKELAKDKRIVVIGVRHGCLYIQMDGDAQARRLRCKLSQACFKPGLLLLQELPTPVVVPNPHDEIEFRFGTQRGGLGVFDATVEACAAFGLRPGQMVKHSPNPRNMGRTPSSLLRNRRKSTVTDGGPAAAPPPREAYILGVRQGSLWRVDKFDKEAKPFIGVTDRSTLLEKLVIEEGPVCRLASQTW